MKNTLMKLLAVTGLAGLLASASASTIVTGTLYNTGAGSTVDHIAFTTGGGTVDIDLLSMEQNQNTGLYQDVNGDGEIAFFDPYIYLFFDDGSLDAGDFITSVDDSGSTYGDGSIHGYDSFLSINLAAGNYILAVGAFSLNLGNAIDGLNDGNTYPVGENYVPIDHGDYQVTFTGDVTVAGAGVPDAASTLALFGLGLIGLAGLRRKLVR